MLKIEKTLWPLTVWMRIFGFPMGVPARKEKSGTKNYSVCLLLTGSLMLLSTVALHCTSFAHGVLRLRVNNKTGPGISNVDTNNNNLTTANLLNTGIEHLNNTWFNIGVHSTFFLVCSLTSNWKGLWDSLLRIEKNLKFKSSFYRKCRESVSVGFGCLLLDFVAHLFISVHSSYWDLGAMRSLAVVLANISRTTITSVFLLFCVTARVITLVFKALNKQIVNLTEAEKILPIYLTARILNLRLERWRRNHTLACELVDMANKCFGLVMLVTIINVFVSFVTTSFEIVSSMGNHESLPFSLLLIFVNKSILLAIVFFESYRLQSEAGRTAASLRKLHPLTADLFTQIKVNTVVMEVTHASPKIAAMEFFDVNIRLLPTLIGSTLTYVAILHQVAAHSK